MGDKPLPLTKFSLQGNENSVTLTNENIKENTGLIPNDSTSHKKGTLRQDKSEGKAKGTYLGKRSPPPVGEVDKHYYQRIPSQFPSTIQKGKELDPFHPGALLSAQLWAEVDALEIYRDEWLERPNKEQGPYKKGGKQPMISKHNEKGKGGKNQNKVEK